MHELRPFQKDALSALKTPAHVICVAPTGSGKSLIYEEAAKSLRSRMLLITPLVALARQQFRQLNESGIPTVLGIGGEDANPPEGSGAWIVSPESLLSPLRQSRLRKWKPDFLVVDECHCLWEWGENFRPAFQEIPPLVDELKISRSLWLTATLSPPARAQIKRALGDITEIGRFELPPNLVLSTLRMPWEKRSQALLQWISLQDGPGIVFSQTRESSERLFRLLSHYKKTVAYHAGLSKEERQGIEKDISLQKPEIISATSAFGMGMHYEHLRWVALWQAPTTLLSMAQAIGRVARDRSHRARALILWDSEDFRISEWTLSGSRRRQKDLAHVAEFLRAARCRKKALEDFFEKTLPESPVSCGSCDYCVGNNKPTSCFY